jgi:hypothetical protein
MYNYNEAIVSLSHAWLLYRIVYSLFMLILFDDNSLSEPVA